MKEKFKRSQVNVNYDKKRPIKKASQKKKIEYYAKKVYGGYGTPDDTYWDFLKPKSEDFING